MHSYTFTLHAQAAHPVLPRLALIFSRRRLRIRHLEMTEAGEPGVNRYRVTLDCDPAMAERLGKQFRRIVEVSDVAVAPAAVRAGPVLAAVALA